MKRIILLIIVGLCSSPIYTQTAFESAESYHDFIVGQKWLLQSTMESIVDFEVADSTYMWDAYYNALATVKNCIKQVQMAGHFDEDEAFYNATMQLFTFKEDGLLTIYPQLIQFYLIKEPVNEDFILAEQLTSDYNRTELLMEKLFTKAQIQFVEKYQFTPKDPFAEE